MQRKVAELDEQVARAQAAREAIRHGLRCRLDGRWAISQAVTRPAAPRG